MTQGLLADLLNLTDASFRQGQAAERKDQPAAAEAQKEALVALSCAMAREAEPGGDPLVTVAELLDAPPPLCSIPGPSHARCMRTHRHPSPCAALGTDSEGVPIVVCWWPAGISPAL
jgi:hypothetical protein